MPKWYTLNGSASAIALGHPLDATGVRLTITLAREMQRIDVRNGESYARICDGEGIALLFRNSEAMA
jgi:acetyl-CoA C-acetyltransferase